MSGNVISIPENYVDSVQSVVNGFVGTIVAWFPDLLLISFFVLMTILSIRFIKNLIDDF